MARLKRHRIAILAILLVGVLSAAASAHFGFFFHWWRVPVAPVPDGTEFVVDAENGLLYQIVFDSTVMPSTTTRTRTDLDTSITSAKVDAGVLTIEQIDLIAEDPNDLTAVVVLLNPADLHQSFFGSFFAAHGTIEVNGGSPIPVYYSGSITKLHGGDYRLRATVRGFETDNDGAGITTVTLFRLNLNGSEFIPPP